MKKTISRNIVFSLAGLILLVLYPFAHAEKSQAIDFKKYWAAYSDIQGIEKLLPFFSEDVVYEDVTFAIVNHGKKEFRKFFSDTFNIFPDQRFTLTSVLVSGNHAALEWTMNGTQKGDMPGMPATNKEVTVRGVSIMEIRRGKITHVRDYWDMATMRRQLGFNP